MVGEILAQSLVDDVGRLDPAKLGHETHGGDVIGKHSKRRCERHGVPSSVSPSHCNNVSIDVKTALMRRWLRPSSRETAADAPIHPADCGWPADTALAFAAWVDEPEQAGLPGGLRPGQRPAPPHVRERGVAQKCVVRVLRAMPKHLWTDVPVVHK